MIVTLHELYQSKFLIPRLIGMKMKTRLLLKCGCTVSAQDSGDSEDDDPVPLPLKSSWRASAAAVLKDDDNLYGPGFAIDGVIVPSGIEKTYHSQEKGWGQLLEWLQVRYLLFFAGCFFRLGAGNFVHTYNFSVQVLARNI